MNELIINNKRVDLSENTNIGLTFSANNIGELQNRQGNFSNTFKLPTSKTNKEIFEWSHLQTSASLMPYKKLKATYIQNGIEIVSDGIAEITNVDNNYYYVNVYSGNLDFMGAIGEATIGDLYKNDIVYNWSTYYVINRRYVYDYIFFPIIDWREDLDFFLTDTIDVRQMLPCATMPQLFNRLSTYTGFTFVGNYLSNVEHTTMFLTPNEFTIPSSSATVTSQKLKTKKIITATVIPTGSVTSVITNFPTFRNENNISDFNIGVFKPSINKIGKLKFAGKYDLFFKSSPIPAWKTISKKQAYIDVSITDITGTIDIYGPIIYGPYDYKDNGVIDIALDIETPEMTFLANTEYKARIRTYVAQTNKQQSLELLEYDSMSPTNAISGETTYPHYLKFTPSPNIAFNNPLDFKNIFTMKIKDVLKDILNLRGVIIQTNNYTKTISFNSFEDVNLNKSIAKDWSGKIQNSTSMSFKFGNYARKNNFLFKDDTDRVNNADNYHNYTVYLNNETLDDEKTVVKLAHPTTIITGRYNGFNVPTINGLKDATNEWKKSDWRILNTKVQNTNFNVNYTDGTTTTAINTFLPFCDIIGFETLVPKYYPTITSILENPKVLKVVAKLDVTDISDLDFSIPIQIQRPDLNLSGYFYINKIENYKGNLTSCEIIEI